MLEAAVLPAKPKESIPISKLVGACTNIGSAGSCFFIFHININIYIFMTESMV